MLGLRAVRSLRSALPKAQKSIISQRVARTIATSSRVHSEPAPTLYGEGAKAGEVPTDTQQATGLERLQLLGHLEGVDVFHMGPLMMSKPGTLEDPTVVQSFAEERVVGCSGYPAESHDLLWITLNQEREVHRCPECGNVFKMNFVGEAHGHGHGHH